MRVTDVRVVVKHAFSQGWLGIVVFKLGQRRRLWLIAFVDRELDKEDGVKEHRRDR